MNPKIVFIALLINLGSGLHAQDSIPVPSSIIKFSPFELISSTFMMEIESFNTAKTKGTSFGLGLTYAERTDYEDERVRGVKGEFIHRIYLSPFSQRTSKKGNDYLLGIYGALFLRGGYEEIEHEFYRYNDLTGVSSMETNIRSGYWVFPGVMIGVTRSYWERLLVDLYVGAGIRAVSVENSNNDYTDSYYYYYHVSPLDYGGVSPNIGIKIGLSL